jgi:uncharacterized protein (TIGR00369 family)
MSDEASERTRVVTWDDPAEARQQSRHISGSELFDKMRRGEIAQPPFARLLGIELFDVGEGSVTMTLSPHEIHYNPMGCVHGGILTTLLDSVMSAAVHAALPPGKAYLTLGININFLKPVYEHSGEIMAHGTVVSIRRQVAAAEGRIVDVKGEICVTGSATCLVFDLPGGRRLEPESKPWEKSVESEPGP